MKTKPTWLVANWKMHGNRAAVQAFAYEMNATLASIPSQVRLVFCPPSVYLDAAHSALPQNAQLYLGAQDCHASLEGAFTGDTSAAMIKESGAGFVIVGHSERRAQHGETDAIIAEKLRTAQAAGLTPIFCVGESAEAYQSGQTAYVLAAQLAAFAKHGAADMLVAYEPIWAIGSGKTPTVKEIAAAHTTIKSILGSDTTILYGGSVKPANIAEIIAIESVSGVLIGGASLQIADMHAMMQAV
jgi:triosephosphate isomerase